MKRVLLAVALVAGILTIPVLGGDSSAATQLSVWKGSDVHKYNEYWELPLNQPANYTTPANYADGQAYVKIVVTAKPSAKAVKPSICFWRHEGAVKFKYETCANTGNIAFTTTGTYYVALGSPNSWWKKNGVYNWAYPATLGRIMANDVLSGTLLLSTNCGAKCYLNKPSGTPPSVTGLDQHVPIAMTSELIFVAKGDTFAPPADWRASCPTSVGRQAVWCDGGGTTPTTTTPGSTTTTTRPPASTTTTTAPGSTTTTTKPATTTTTTLPSGGTVVIPGTPTKPTLTITPGDRRLATSWTLPDARLFQLRWKLASDAAWSWTEPGTATSRTITGLSNGSPYQVQVRAYVNGTWQNWTVASVVPGA